jgi:hypothetical protein
MKTDLDESALRLSLKTVLRFNSCANSQQALTGGAVEIPLSLLQYQRKLIAKGTLQNGYNHNPLPD